MGQNEGSGSKICDCLPCPNLGSYANETQSLSTKISGVILRCSTRINLDGGITSATNPVRASVDTVSKMMPICIFDMEPYPN